MPLGGLRLENLRCFAQADVDFGGAPAILSGANGSGKTTLLEGIYLLSRGRSFRSGYPNRLIRRGCQAVGVEADVLGTSIQRRVRVTYEKKIVATIDHQAATIREISQLLPLTLMDAGIAQIVLGGAEQRRKLLDWLMFHVEPESWIVWKQYRRALRQWQWALRKGMDGAVWIERMLVGAPRIEASRKRLIAACLPHWHEAFESLFPGRNWSLDYSPGVPPSASLASALQGWAPERATQPLAPGPHRAEIEIRVDGAPARHMLSRGQGKLLSIGLMWGGAHMLAQHLQACPLLLIDDFASELDTQAQARLLALLARGVSQVILTAVTPVRKEETSCKYRLFHVEQGHIRWSSS